MALQPTTWEIRDCFATEIAALGGTIADEFCLPQRLFLRALLPSADEVSPRDTVHGGVALRSSEGEILLHPFVFREVCRNGAIMSQILDTRHLRLLPEDATPFNIDCVVREIGELVRQCAAPEVFQEAVELFRNARQTPLDNVMAALAMLARLGSGIPPQIFESIAERLVQESDGTRYGLLNAVTSVARDTRDPELRWRLEELGGGVPALLVPRVPERPAGRLHAAAVR